MRFPIRMACSLTVAERSPTVAEHPISLANMLLVVVRAFSCSPGRLFSSTEQPSCRRRLFLLMLNALLSLMNAFLSRMNTFFSLRMWILSLPERSAALPNASPTLAE
jgi:hypothetical protein